MLVGRCAICSGVKVRRTRSRSYTTSTGEKHSSQNDRGAFGVRLPHSRQRNSKCRPVTGVAVGEGQATLLIPGLLPPRRHPNPAAYCVKPRPNSGSINCPWISRKSCSEGQEKALLPKHSEDSK